MMLIIIGTIVAICTVIFVELSNLENQRLQEEQEKQERIQEFYNSLAIGINIEPLLENLTVEDCFIYKENAKHIIYRLFSNRYFNYDTRRWMTSYLDIKCNRSNNVIVDYQNKR